MKSKPSTEKYSHVAINTDLALECLNESCLIKSSDGDTLTLISPITLIEFLDLPGVAEAVSKGWLLLQK
jgi:hypothetical protein